MATNFPTSLDSFTNPTSSNNLNDVSVLHATQHTNENDAVTALETKVGINGSAVTTTLDYLLKSASSTNPGHKHTEAALTLADVTTDNVSSTMHGLVPKSPASATQFLNGAATPAFAQVKDSDLAVTDIVTNNASSTAHGFAPKSPGDATKVLNGAATPAYGTAVVLLASVAGVDFNIGTATALYTVPAAKSCIVDSIIIRNASASLTTASVSFGFNSTTYNNVVANATHTELTGNTLYTRLSPMVGATRGAAADVLNVLANTLQGSAATVTIDVFGYLY